MSGFCTIGIQLVTVKGGEFTGLYSRGGTVNIYGIDACYMGTSPDGLAWFWLAPGDIRPLDAEQLASQGLALTDALQGKKKGK